MNREESIKDDLDQLYDQIRTLRAGIQEARREALESDTKLHEIISLQSQQNQLHADAIKGILEVLTKLSNIK